MKISYLVVTILKRYKNFIFFPRNIVVISVYTYGVKIIKKSRGEVVSPLCTNKRSGYLMQLSVNHEVTTEMYRKLSLH